MSYVELDVIDFWKLESLEPKHFLRVLLQHPSGRGRMVAWSTPKASVGTTKGYPEPVRPVLISFQSR